MIYKKIDMSKQQTVLRVQNKVSFPTQIPRPSLDIISVLPTGSTYTGLGTSSLPYVFFDETDIDIILEVKNTSGIFYFNRGNNSNIKFDIKVSVQHEGSNIERGFKFNEITNFFENNFKVEPGDIIKITVTSSINVDNFTCYFIPDLSLTSEFVNIEYLNLDLYDDIPIKINKSFAELGDISKKNSDISVGLKLPGSKINNKFFENYYNVNGVLLNFDITKRTPCNVLIDDEKVFTGYLKLNKINIINSKLEYDVTLYSTVADLYGKIGNNTLNNLDFNDIDYHFNHYFTPTDIFFKSIYHENIFTNKEFELFQYFITHNGYEYNNGTVNVTGGTEDTQTRLYSSTIVGSYNNLSSFYSAGGLDGRINSPENGLLMTQLKPSISVPGLINLMFKTYGYQIKSKFFNTPWFKTLYMYGYFDNDQTKLTLKNRVLPPEPISNIEIKYNIENEFTATCESNVNVFTRFTFAPYKFGSNTVTNIEQDINFVLEFEFKPCDGSTPYLIQVPLVINKTNPITVYEFNQLQYLDCGLPCQPEEFNFVRYVTESSDVPFNSTPLSRKPSINTDGKLVEIMDYIDFSELIDENIKQIDFLSSIIKKFNLVIVPSPDNDNELIIEPYDYFIGTGQIHDWTQKLSYDKGFSIEPTINFIESEIILTDKEDGDDGNKTFKDRNNKIYGENRVLNNTDFKSQTKKIETIFSPQIVRKWEQSDDSKIQLPLGINYSASSRGEETVQWEYKGLKSNPKLLFSNGGYPFFMNYQNSEYTENPSGINTFYIKLEPNVTNQSSVKFNILTINNNTPFNLTDEFKINNDTISILFNSEQPKDIGIGITTLNTFTNNNLYNLFYSNRINNLFDKNTRMLSGHFNLTKNDIINIRPEDLIKIQDQYFTVNKIEGYNLSNTELTKVELIQTNNIVKTYPERYFKYVYSYSGDTVSDEFKFKTYFDPTENPSDLSTSQLFNEVPNSLRRTYWYWSIFYDFMYGEIVKNETDYDGITILNINFFSSSPNRIIKINEITKDEYDNITLTNFNDPRNDFFINNQFIFRNLKIERQDYFFFLNLKKDIQTMIDFCNTNSITVDYSPVTPI
jgi:hypothetical protein